MSNTFDPDQAGHIFQPDLGPNCLQRIEYQQTMKAAGSKETVQLG